MKIKDNFYSQHISKIVLLLIFFMVTCIPFFILSERDIVLYFVNCRNKTADVFFSATTSMGSFFAACTFFVTTFIINDFYKIKKANNIALLSFVFTSIIVYSLKYIVRSPRPCYIIELSNLLEPEYLSSICNFNESFPSGHSATAFMIACATSIVFKINKNSFFLALIILASFVSYSRLYLLHHFYTDIYFGALIGSTCTFITAAVIGSKYN